ncbi:MAG: GtrA family protein [Hyphomicrobiales bacterium]|nr:GtrA family protein [Hyphomicrobiales bacterium]MBV8826207.1 GtrA family protein [Hyphomicrobiales bacterium]MBV9427627.1 GtrA family protein [Bradyrhizobiaceae bacterium]
MSLRRVISLYVSRQFGWFLLAGGIAALANWLSRFVFNLFMTYGEAIAAAFAVGMAVAFVLNKRYVFPYSRRPLVAEMSYFVLFNLVAFPVVWAIAYLLGERILPGVLPRQFALAFGHGCAVAVPALVNFVLHKSITFRGA